MSVYLALIKAVGDWRECLRFRAGQTYETTYIKSLAAVLEQANATPEEIEQLSVKVLASEEYMPTPATCLQHLLSCRGDAFNLARGGVLEDPNITAFNLDTRSIVFAKRSRVRDGLLLAPGDHSGNGVAFDGQVKMALMRNHPEWFSKFSLKLYNSVVMHETGSPDPVFTAELQRRGSDCDDTEA